MYNDPTANEISNCMEKEPAFCTDACPFHLDVKEMIAKIRRGRFAAAYHLYQDAVAYPQIVSSLCTAVCRERCPRSQIDTAIEMQKLEQTVCRLQKDRKPRSYNLPQNKGRIAIVGAGPSGLACMKHLALRKYAVTVYEKSDRIGGHLWQKLSPQIFLSDIETQHQGLSFEIKLGVEVTDDPPQGYDAVYIATGSGGSCSQAGSGPPFWVSGGSPGVFYGGSMLGADTVSAIAAGLGAATAIESYLQTGAMPQPLVYKSRLTPDQRLLSRTPPQMPPPAAEYNEEQARREADRCLECGCNSCFTGCKMLSSYKKPVRRVFDEASMAAFPTSVDGTASQGKRMVSSCNQCGLCKTVCPQGIDIGSVLLESRRELIKNNAMPWVFHEYWLRDMSFAASEDALLAAPAPGEESCQYLFFPGCQLSAADPDLTKATYEALLKQNPSVGIFLGCCGVPALWSGEQPLFEEHIQDLIRRWEGLGSPTILTACPNCQKVFQQYAPELPVRSVVRYWLDNGGPVPSWPEAQTVSVCDPCGARGDHELQESVRKAVRSSGLVLRELEENRDEARCCSFGGHIYPANPGLAREIIAERVAENELPYIVYCSNCKDAYTAKEKKTVHILEILLGRYGQDYRPPTPTQRKQNRIRLRSRILSEYWSKTAVPEQGKAPVLTYAEGVKEQLAKELMLEEDVLQAVLHGETTGEKIEDPLNSRFFASVMVGHCTIWAEYAVSDDGFTIFDVYCHRMKILADD